MSRREMYASPCLDSRKRKYSTSTLFAASVASSSRAFRMRSTVSSCSAPSIPELWPPLERAIALERAVPEWRVASAAAAAGAT
eukprot:CAMPEP_0119095534 /NCGR_PEP_ID=MMETSP1178-20130426/169889_1 /TAXON_ID=33656 /ORGANISM="unid sp, Strain CCMP2000" /LENGTH=82 /DNA_ID=CAMNT_0007079353 /DNA_START=249 /DNA_END=494 /DNA_ORIENTATION=+